MRGLNVSLSTDDPRQVHLTNEPLVEQVPGAAQVVFLRDVAAQAVLESDVFSFSWTVLDREQPAAAQGRACLSTIVYGLLCPRSQPRDLTSPSGIAGSPVAVSYLPLSAAV